MASIATAASLADAASPRTDGARAAPPLDAPSISSLAPSSAVVGTGPARPTVNGTNVARTSVVRRNDSDRATTFVSTTQLRATTPATDLTMGGSAKATVVNPAPTLGPSDPAAVTVCETMIRGPA